MYLCPSLTIISMFILLYCSLLFSRVDVESSDSVDENEQGPGEDGARKADNMDITRAEKHKKRKHKHRSKHRKHKYPSPDERNHKHKNKHKHKRKHRDSLQDDRNCSAGCEGAVISTKRSRLDDLAALEDLEKQRAMIQAELDNELMEGAVQSGMGLILQGYNSDSEEDGEIQQAVQNGEKQRQVFDARGHAGRSQQDYIDDEKIGTLLEDGSMSDEMAVRAHKSEKRVSKTELEVNISEKPSGSIQVRKRRRSQSIERSKEGGQRSKSPVKSKDLSSSNKKSTTWHEEQIEDHRSSERRSKSRSKERNTNLPEADRERDNKSVKAPSKEALSGKENRSPSRKQSAEQHSLSVRPRSHHSPEHLPVAQSTDRASRQDRSSWHNRSPPRRGRSRSVERRRREEDRQRLSNDRF